MRVLTTSLCYPTPAHPDYGIFIQRRAEALAARGVEVEVVAPQPWCPLARSGRSWPAAVWPLPAAYPRMFSMPVVGWAADGLAYGLALYRWMCSQPRPFDLIDAHFVYPDGVGAWLAGRRLGIPVVVTVRGKIVSLSKKAVRRAQIAAMLRGVQARIAVSRSLAGWVHRVGGSDLEVEVIPNGVEVEQFRRTDRGEARRRLGWPAEPRYLLAVGHLQHVKGFDRIVEALPAVRSAVGDVRLVLVGSRRGEAGFRRRLAKLIAACGHPQAIRFLGPTDPAMLNDLYNAADVLVNTSRSEGWNNAISEALAVGTPVLATDVGGNAEQVRSPQLGMVVPDGDAQALIDGLVAALGQSWNRPLIAAHGGARQWPQVGREVQSVLERALAAHRPQPADIWLDTDPLMAEAMAVRSERVEVGA